MFEQGSDDKGRAGAPIDGTDQNEPVMDRSVPSSRRVEANRQNAKKSTGPRTAEGKDRSSKNAIKHGAFVSRLTMISKGAFREDPEEFRAQVRTLLDALRPRDGIESALATRITGLFINCDRLDRWSNATYERASTIREIDELLGARSWPSTYMAAQMAQGLVEYLDGERPDADYSVLATFLRTYGPSRGVDITDLWDNDHEPSTDSDWRKAFEILKTNFWPNPSDAYQWAVDVAFKLSNRAEEVDGVEEQIAASRILQGPFDLHLKYFARIRREMTELLKLYETLQQRPLPPSGKNEPNESGVA